MLDEAQINLNVGRLLYWSLMTTGALILGTSFIHYIPGLSALGVAFVVVGCSIAIERSVLAHDAAMRQAFELGRRMEREGKVAVLAEL